MTMMSTAHGHNSSLPVLSAVKTAATAVQTEPANIGQKFWHIESISAAYSAGSSSSRLPRFFGSTNCIGWARNSC